MFFDQINEREFKQGGYGTCAYLSVLNSMLQTSAGREHLEGLISAQNNGFTVNFPNRDPIFISNDRILNDEQVSTGSIGVSVIDAALIEVQNKEGVMSSPFEVIAGEAESWTIPIGSDGVGKNNGFLQNLFAAGASGHAMLTTASATNTVFEDENGNYQTVLSSHAYSVFPNETGTITLENPYDTSVKFTLTEEEFINRFDTINASAVPGNEVYIDPKNLAVANLANELADQQYDVWAATGATSKDSVVTSEGIANAAAAIEASANISDALVKEAHLSDFRDAVTNINAWLPPGVLEEVQAAGRIAVDGESLNQGAEGGIPGEQAAQSVGTAMPPAQHETIR